MDNGNANAGAAIAACMEAKGIKPSGMARILSVSAAHIHDITHGKRRPSPELLQRMVNVLGVSYTVSDRWFAAYGMLPPALSEALQRHPERRTEVLSILSDSGQQKGSQGP